MCRKTENDVTSPKRDDKQFVCHIYPESLQLPEMFTRVTSIKILHMGYNKLLKNTKSY